MKRLIEITAVIMMSMFLFSCAGASKQHQGLGAGAVIGAIGGAILGQVIGGDTEATLLGAGIGTTIGGLAGHQIGTYMDRQEQELKAALAANEAVSIKREMDILTATFKSEVLFAFDSFTLKSGGYAEIKKVADVLKTYIATSIRVEGHTDSIGSESYNMQLSEKRAHAVKNALIQMGVSSSRIQTVGYGESQPRYSSDAMNRRVNIVIIPI